jgi:hypothetical protein
MFAVEMLNDEKVVERQDQPFLAQARGIPQHDILLFPFFNGGELEIPQCGILRGVFGSRSSHEAPLLSGIVTDDFPDLQWGIATD